MLYNLFAILDDPHDSVIILLYKKTIPIRYKEWYGIVNTRGIDKFSRIAIHVKGST